jgi:hypothetical protein
MCKHDPKGTKALGCGICIIAAGVILTVLGGILPYVIRNYIQGDTVVVSESKLYLRHMSPVFRVRLQGLPA